MKQIKKFLVALILVLAIFLVACEAQECPECENKECDKSEVCEGLIDPSTCPAAQECPEPQECPTCPEVTCPEFDTAKECKEAGYIQPGECAAGITAPESIEFYSEDIALGGTVKFEVEVLPEKAYQGLVWSSSDPSIATVAEDGTITGIKPGKVTITAKSSVDANVKYAEEVEVVEKGLLDYEIAEREKNAIVAALSEGYVSADFDLPTTWNASAKVVYSDPNGKEITTFTMPDLGEATSQNYALSGSVTYKDSVSEFNVTLKLVKVAEGKNDYEKVAFACEVAEAFLYEYLTGTKVEKDVFLPTSVYGVALNWATNKAYVLTADGKLTAPNNDTEVQFTITPKLGAASASKTFKVVAAGFGEEDKIEYLLKQGALAQISGKEFTGSIPLPTLDPKFGIKLTYVSQNPQLIENDGKINDHAYDTAKQEVKFTVTAVYNDLNSPNDAFTKVFELSVFVAANNDATGDVVALANNAAYAQFKHVAYGQADYDAVAEKQYVITPAQAAALGAGWTFAGDENFKVNPDNSVELVTQYFRYHEGTLKATYEAGNGDKATYVWTLNVGIGAEPFITYLGGRSQSYQASANPAERGDSLQGFSYWDKYVGIVANNNERTSQQYWSEFSGYTAYVDIPTTGLNEVIYTLDAQGNVTIYPTDVKAHIRQQMFYMEFAILRITEVKTFYAAVANEDGTYSVKKNGNTKVEVKYPVLANKESVRSTYGGNFGSLYVNETANDIDIPVSALSMGGTFTDGEAMKTYTKSAIIVMIKTAGKYMVDGEEKDLKAEEAYTLVDDWGANTTVKREQTWALDGYRPAMGAKPKTDAVLTEGTINKEYTFTFGIQDSQEHYESNYIQYGIKSTVSDLWGTTYVVLPKHGFIYAWHSQTLYSFSGMGGGYIAGADKSLPIYFSRYYRHANNEELSDYVRNDIRSYFVSLTGITAADYNELDDNGDYKLDLAKVAITFDDLGPAELAKIEKLQARLDALNDSWKEKADVDRAVEAMDLIIAAAKDELDAQAAYANLTESLFLSVKAAYIAGVVTPGLALDQIKNWLDTNADYKAKVAAANRNYESLTAGQKALYDNGYDPDVLDGTNPNNATDFTFVKKQTTYIATTIEFVNTIVGLGETVSASNKETIAKYDANAALTGGHKKTYENLSAAAKELVPALAKTKLDDLVDVVTILNTKATTAAVNTSKAFFAAFNGVNPYPTATYTEATAADPVFSISKLYFKDGTSGKEVVATPVEADFNNHLYYLITETPADKCSPKQLFIAKSFKDVKNDDKSTTWGLDAFFNDLLKQEADKQAADLKAAADLRVAQMAKTVTLAAQIKATIEGLPAAKDVKNEGLGDSKAAYNGLISYNADIAKTGKVDELVRLYKILGLTTQNLTIASDQAVIKAVLTKVTGMYKATEDEAIVENKKYFTKSGAADANGVWTYTEVEEPLLANIATYFELEAEIGNFSGSHEDDYLDDLAALPGAVDIYEAKVVEDKINALPAKKNVQISDKAAVKAAKDAYNALNATRQALVTNFGDIAILETEIARQETNAKIDPVADLIDNLPKAGKAELTDEAAINAAKKAYDALNVTGTNAHDYRVDFDTKYETVDEGNLKTKLNALVAELETLIVNEVKEDAAFKAAIKAFKETESIGIVNKEKLAEAEDLIAKYEAVSGHALETLKDATKHAQADWTADNANWAKTLYNRLLATVAAYKAYTAVPEEPAE